VGVVTRSCRPFITGTRCHFPFWDYLIIKAVPLILCDGSIMTWWQRWQQRLISPNYGTLQATTKPLFGRHKPRKNVVYEGHNLLETKQQDGQSFSHYLRDLRTLTRSCDLVQVDNMIGGKIVFRMYKMPLEVNELRGKVVRFTERGVWCVVLMTRWFPGLVPLHKKCLARLLLLLHQIPTLPMSSKVERL